MMIHAAKSALPNSATPQFALIVVTMCCLAAEALANAVGQRIFKEWADFDMLSPWGKYRLICRELKIPCDKGRGIWQQLNNLLALRNRITHAKPEQVKTSALTTLGEYNSSTWFIMHPFPPSSLEQELTQETAKKSMQTIEAVLSTIADTLVGDDKEFIAGDIAQHEIALANHGNSMQP